MHTVNRTVYVSLHKKIIDGFDILIFTCISGAKDSADTNGVLIYKVYCFFGIDNVAFVSAEDILD